MLPAPSGVHARILQLGKTGSGPQSLLGGQGWSLHPGLAVAEKWGHRPVQLAGQEGSLGAWAVRGCLCPPHSLPAAPLLCRLLQQHPKPSACIQHVLPSLQRGGCACPDRLLYSQLAANSEAKPRDAQGQSLGGTAGRDEAVRGAVAPAGQGQ